MRWTSILGSIVLAAALAGGVWHRVWLPPEWDPTQPLDLRAPQTPVTPLKRQLLDANPALCRAALATAPLRFRDVDDNRGACPLHDAVRVTGAPVATAPSSFLASCRLAVDWSLFLTRTAMPQAEAQFGRKLTTIEHLGSFSCRDIRDRPGLQSSHARADAIDVSAFVLAGGHRIAVSRWSDPGPDGRFLHALRDGACRDFGIVLSPDFNALHAGHLHLEAGSFGFCR